MLDEALAKAGLDRCTLGYTAKDWSMFGASVAHDPYRLPWYDAVHDHAVRAPSFARGLVSKLDAAAASKLPVAGALAVAAYGLGAPPTPCVTPFAVDAAQPLARAVAQIIRDGGGIPDDAALEADAADVPLPLQQALAQVVLAASEANAAWAALSKPLSAADRAALALVPGFTLSTIDGPPAVSDKAVRSLLSTRFDEIALARGAVTLALRVESAQLAAFVGQRGFEF